MSFPQRLPYLNNQVHPSRLYAKWAAIFCALGLTWISGANAAEAACSLAGAGTVASPFEIATYADLKQLGPVCGMAAHYKLVDSIDASPSASDNGGKGFQIVGSWDEPFQGSLHGQGFSIRNLFQNDTLDSYGGIFGMLDTFAVVDHLGIHDFRIWKAYTIGGLAAYNKGVIRDCQVSRSVFGPKSYPGGLVGTNYGRLVSCTFNDSLIGDSSSTAGGLVGTNYAIIDSSVAHGYIEGRQVGGIAGFSSGHVRFCRADTRAKGLGRGSLAGSLVAYNLDTIESSSATGDVEGYQIGGLVGFNTGKIRSSWASGNVKSTDTSSQAGGLVGWSTGPILDCHASGDVVGFEAGGLVGWSTKPIRRSHATGNVTGIGYYSEAGGLVGWGGDTIESCWAEGTATGFQAGGLVGWATGHILRSVASGDVTGIGETSEAGGLVGSNGRKIVGSSATGNVTGNGIKAQIGGLVGWNADSILSSASTGNVVTTGDSAYAGGLIGCNASFVRDAFATGGVTGKMWVGGLVGKEWQGRISNTYAVGKITKTSAYAVAGGLVGFDSAVVGSSYWDLQTTGMVFGAGQSRKAWGINAGMTTAQMHDSANFKGFSFAPDSAWTIVQNQNYPQLRMLDLGSTSQVVSSGALRKEMLVRRIGNSLELELDAGSRVRLLDSKGRTISDFGTLAAGLQKLSIPSNERILFVQVRSAASNRTIAVGGMR